MWWGHRHHLYATIHNTGKPLEFDGSDSGLDSGMVDGVDDADACSGDRGVDDADA